MLRVRKAWPASFSLLKKIKNNNRAFVLGRQALANQVGVTLANQRRENSSSTNQQALDEEKIWKENWERRCDLATAYRGLAK